ncbi:nucleotide pyrophosphohydrolase [Agromyces sp. NPDC056379]|uniref:nucleotide pyrophosphohydrolase n=1 Tax=unclassified Agromyces TaxID=2639701 RepID=UPI0035DEE99E
MTDEAVINALRSFVAERDWGQFHSQENLAKSIAIEAGELLECFQWGAEPEPTRVHAELADVLTYCLLLTDALGVDPNEIVLAKLASTKLKYPVEKARGRAVKYDEL